MTIICVSDMVEANGRTVRQNNLELTHDIPLGTLVEIGDPEYPNTEYDSTDGLRLFVVGHSRDCDGTPLYDMSFNREAQSEVAFLKSELEQYRESSDEMFRLTYMMLERAQGKILRHYGRSSLTVIERTKK